MRREDMALRFADEARGGTPLSLDVLEDEPNQKIIRGLHRLALAPGQEFDVSLSFQWRGSAAERQTFDCLNLMYFRHPVGLLRYRVVTPPGLKQPRVRAFGIGVSDPSLASQTVESLPGQPCKYEFAIKSPRPVVYLIDLER